MTTQHDKQCFIRCLGSDIKPPKKGLLQRIRVVISYVWREKLKIEGRSCFAVPVKLRVSNNIK